jgi:hypothetical protein
MEYPWGAIYGSKASEGDAKISIMEENSSSILDGFKRSKTE